MNTSELVKAVAMETGLTASATEKVVNAVFSTIKKEVSSARSPLRNLTRGKAAIREPE